MNKTPLDTYFLGKPKTYEIFKAVEQQIASLGPSTVSVGKQISYGNARKFAWFWLYNVTQKDPNGILHLMLASDKEIDDPHVRRVVPIGNNRWNHQIVIRTLDDAKSQWLKDLIKNAYQYSLKN